MLMPNAFPEAVKIVLEHEGGYVNDPNDPGGETKFGISKRWHPHLDIKNLTKEEAADIYREEFWERYGYGRILSFGVAAKLLDMAVNMGPRPAHTCLQMAIRAHGLSIDVDGILGPETLALVNSLRSRLLPALRSEASAHYRVIAAEDPAKRRYLEGWLNRAYAVF